MKYFIDFEFIEGFSKPLLYPVFGKKRHFIDLISVGIVCEDGMEYYAISKEFNPKDADKWGKENVIAKLPEQYISSNGSSPREMQGASLWKNNNMIVFEIKEFFGCVMNNGIWNEPYKWTAPNNIEVYGYYADYDWVLLCSLFGRMIDLPNGFPMYCIDLKQTLDEQAKKWRNNVIKTGQLPEEQGYYLSALKSSEGYPKQSNEHNALADAKWNKDLYNFIQSL